MMIEYDGDVPDLVLRVRLHENAVTFMPGDSFPHDHTSYERLVFLLAKEHIMPASADWHDLPEPLFTDVMEKRD